jgi:hypothetical protein
MLGEFREVFSSMTSIMLLATRILNYLTFPYPSDNHFKEELLPY